METKHRRREPETSELRLWVALAYPEEASRVVHLPKDTLVALYPDICRYGPAMPTLEREVDAFCDALLTGSGRAALSHLYERFRLDSPIEEGSLRLDAGIANSWMSSIGRLLPHISLYIGNCISVLGLSSFDANQMFSSILIPLYSSHTALLLTSGEKRVHHSATTIVEAWNECKSSMLNTETEASSPVRNF